MPDAYEILSMLPETAVTSPTTTLAVTRVGFMTKPSGVVAYINVPVKTKDPNLVANSVDQYALLIELVMGYPEVGSAYFAQQVDPAGLLADYLVIVVEYESPTPAKIGPYEAEVWELMVEFGNAIGFGNSGIRDRIQHAYAKLAKAVDG